MIKALKRIKKKRCKAVGCKAHFICWNSLQTVCGPSCALALVIAEKDKKARKENRERKRALKTKPEWTKAAQIEFNKYIRCRDFKLPCISCGEVSPGGNSRGGVWDCGHYRSTGSAPELRFCEINAHKQCKHCNRDQSGNHVMYRNNLIHRITAEELAWLEGPHEARHDTIDQLREIKKHYAGKERALRIEIERNC